MTAKRLVLLCFILFGVAVPGWPQYRTSTFTGVVRSGGGLPVPSARIEWVQNGQLRSLLTDSAGKFVSYFVDPGFHTFRFEHTSTSSVGTFGGMVPAGSSLVLSVVLHQDSSNSSPSDRWLIREQLSGVPSAWQPERFLTKEQMEILPSTEHLWSFLNQTEPSVITDRFDISGMQSGSQLLIGVRGSSWSQNIGMLNGMSVTDPSGDGMLVFPDMTTMQAIVYSVGESPTRHTGPGAHVNLIPKVGERELHGETRLFFQSGALQNSNVTSRNRSFGISQSDERWKHFVNGGFQLAGPIGKQPWSYFAAVSGRALKKWVRAQPVPLSGTVQQQTYNLGGAASSRDRVGLYVSLQHRHEPQSGASPQVTRESSVNQRQTYRGVQGNWTRELSSRAVLDLKFGVAYSHVAERFNYGFQTQSAQDLFPGYLLEGTFPDPTPEEDFRKLINTSRGPAPLIDNSSARSSEASAAYSTVRDGFQNSTHRIAIGGSYNRSFLAEGKDAMDKVNLLFFQGNPNTVRLLSTPTQTRNHMSHFELYASDNVSFSRLSLLAQGSADLSRISNVLKYGRSVNNLHWTNIGGRIGASFQFVRRLVLRVGMAQIYDQPNLAAAAKFNPEGLGMAVYSWNDANGDRRFQIGENSQLLKVTGGPFTRVDSNLKNPRTRELTVGFTQSGLKGFHTEFFAFRRSGHQLMSMVNVGLPLSSYEPTTVTDPGWDAIYGTNDDENIIVFNQRSETLGHDSYFLTNPAGFTNHSEGFEFSVGFTSPKIQAKATVTRYRAVADTGPGRTATGNDTANLLGVFDDPNNAIRARGSTFFDRGTLVRMWNTSEFGWGIRTSVIGNYQDGLPWARVLPLLNLNQGITGVMLSHRGPGERGSIGGPRTTHYQTIDVRIAKVFTFAKGKLTASLDVFNVSNLALGLVEAEVTSRTTHLRVPLRFQSPRSLQPGIRYTW